MVNGNTLARQPVVGPSSPARNRTYACKVAVIWIDWYAYHVARFQGLMRHQELKGEVAGLELVGGVGVHSGLKFREDVPSSLPIETLLPDSNWIEASKWSLARSLWRKLNRLQPSAVLVPGYYTIPALASALWAKLNGKTSVLMTESTAYDHSRNWLREGVKRLLVTAIFDWAVAGGKPHRRYLRQLGFPSDRIAGYYDVVDNAFFHDCCNEIRARHSPADFNLPSDYFLYVGRIAEEKGIASLLSEYVRYRLSGGTASLVVVGDGPQLKDVQAMAAMSPYVDDILFEGLRTSAELPKFYAFASAFVLASTREPWGLVVNEAMASSLPVIVSDRCGCVEDLVIEEQNGFTFDPFTGNALALCLSRFQNLESGERALMGRRSYEIISRFSPDAFANQIYGVLKSTT